MFLLDTNALSDAKRAGSPAAAWLDGILPEQVFISVITLGEIAKGIAVRARKDRAAAGALTDWLGQIRRRHARRILPVSDDVALEWGRIAAIRTRSDADGLIAATAIVHDLTVVTRNVVDFHDLPVRVVDPWDRAVP